MSVICSGIAERHKSGFGLQEGRIQIEKEAWDFGEVAGAGGRQNLEVEIGEGDGKRRVVGERRGFAVRAAKARIAAGEPGGKLRLPGGEVARFE